MVKLITFKSINKINTNESFRRSVNLKYEISRIGEHENLENINLIIKLSIQMVQTLLSKTDFKGILKIIYYFAKEKIIDNIKSNSSDNITELNFNFNEYEKYQNKIQSIIEHINLPRLDNPETVEIEFSNKIGF